jgi:hypothetical protein
MNCNSFPENKCREFSDKRKIIIVEENKRKFVGRNNTHKLFSNFRVDGCLIKKGRKCDYLLLDCDENKAYFIELKGKDLLSAIEQIEHSIDVLIGRLGNCTINARIVLTRVNTPDLRSSKYIKLERKLKKLNGNILKKTRILEEDL